MLFCLLPFAALLLRAEGRRGGTVVGNKNIGHALDNDKWLSTVSQYDKDRYWNKFRDVSLELPCFSQLCFQMVFFCQLLDLAMRPAAIAVSSNGWVI